MGGTFLFKILGVCAVVLLIASGVQVADVVSFAGTVTEDAMESIDDIEFDGEAGADFGPVESERDGEATAAESSLGQSAAGASEGQIFGALGKNANSGIPKALALVDDGREASEGTAEVPAVIETPAPVAQQAATQVVSSSNGSPTTTTEPPTTTTEAPTTTTEAPTTTTEAPPSE